jgi:chaperone required for assembly of F1-ATPase
MSWNLKRKFWNDAAVTEHPEGFGVALDTRTLNTPGKRPLIVPTRALAEAVAAEWHAQGEQIDPSTMPFTRACNSAIEKVEPQFQAVAGMLAEYGSTDLICYRADSPNELAVRQSEAWDPWLEWASRELNAPLIAIVGVIHHPQPEPSLAALGETVSAHTPFELTALHDLITLSGSLVLGLAVAKQALDPEDAWALSRIDETWQIEQWGEDAEAREAADAKREQFLQAARLLALLRED